MIIDFAYNLFAKIPTFVLTFQSSIEFFFIAYFSFINVLYTIFLLIGFANVAVRVREINEDDIEHLLKSDSLPSIMFVFPIYNEGEHIISNLENILSLTYRYKQIVAVNDGSTDNSLQLIKDKYELIEVPKYYQDQLPTKEVKQVYQSKSHPDFIVIDKENGGKFDAINSAINAVDSELFVVLDADTYIDNHRFMYLVRPILTSGITIAVGASIRIMNGCDIEYNRIKTTKFPQNFLPAAQSLEYLRAFCLRDGLDVFNFNFIVSGAFSIFPRELVADIGGFSPTKGEDVEIIVRLHRFMLERGERYKVKYFADPVAYTLAPTKLNDLSDQRTRWHLGLLEAFWCHRRICFNPKYKAFGIFGFPFWIICEALEPLLEFLGIVYIITAISMGVLHTTFFLLFIAVTIGYTALYTIFALFVEEFSFREFPSLRSLTMLLIANFVENIGYRQFTLYWRLKGFIQFFKRRKEVKAFSSFVNDLVDKGHKKMNEKKTDPLDKSEK